MKIQTQRTLFAGLLSPDRSSRVSRVCLSLGLGCLALACASEGVDLGGGTVAQNLERGERCAESTRIAENVIVSNQDDLAALAGCEEIDGNLIVRIFAGADLTPLRSLRVVEGEFALGVEERWDEIIGFSINRPPRAQDPDADLIEAGWLSSLSGVQALERVGTMFLRGLPDADLTAFESLESMGGGGGGALRGYLILQQNQLLHDLSGLETLAGVQGLVVTLNPVLETLNGFDSLERLQQVALYTSPALADVGALATVSNLDFLTLFETGVTSLDALAGLEIIRDVQIHGNPALVDASGLGSLQRSEDLSFTSNPQLKILPTFVELTTQPRTIVIRDNPELESLELDLPNAEAPVYYLEPMSVQPEPIELGIDVIDVRENTKLSRISVPSGLTVARLALIEENPALTSIDFGTLRELGKLSIASNDSLSQVGVGALTTVNVLEVTDNPLLSTVVFDGIQTFAEVFSGNAD
jgi:hypothetical protein